MNEENTVGFDLFIESVKNFAKVGISTGESADIEIKETHPSTEQIIPSKVGKMLAEAIAKSQKDELFKLDRDNTEIKVAYRNSGDNVPRKEGEIGISSSRGGKSGTQYGVYFYTKCGDEIIFSYTKLLNFDEKVAKGF